ncbi:hypothetical protein KU6B_19000 [Mameliella alba]|nr:SDR family NAD(P)-dependent oxidoreductase [Mameliella alba]BBU55635.1 hypothetical protein KU6B_19000 [Mameliella alba]
MPGLVNNAGVHELRKSSGMTAEEFEKVMSINATVLFTACRDTLP